MGEPQDLEDINLFGEVAQGEAKTGVFRRRINFAVIAILLLVAVAIAILFGWWLFLASSATRIASQTKTAEEEIGQQAGKEITRRSLVTKLDEARSFLSLAVPFSTSFDKLIGVLKDSGASLKDATFKNDGKVVITGTAGTSDNFGKMLDKLTSEELADTFGQINLTALTFEGSKGTYTFAIDMKFLKKGFPEATESGKLNRP